MAAAGASDVQPAEAIFAALRQLSEGQHLHSSRQWAQTLDEKKAVS